MVEQSEFREVIKVAILKRNIFVRIYKTDTTLSIFFRYKITICIYFSTKFIICDEKQLSN